MLFLQKDTASDQPLHLAALQGNLEQLRTVLETGSVHVDCKDKVEIISRQLVTSTRKLL